jgi:hypothetical protein
VPRRSGWSGWIFDSHRSRSQPYLTRCILCLKLVGDRLVPALSAFCSSIFGFFEVDKRVLQILLLNQNTG